MALIYSLKKPLSVIALLVVHLCAYTQVNTDSLLKILPSQNDTNKVKILDRISHAYLNRDNEKALEYARQALELADKTGNQLLIAYENISVGNMHTSLGDYRTSLQYVLKALKIFEREKNYKGASKAANVLGNIYLGQGNLGKSKEYYETVVKYATMNKDEYTISVGYLGLSNIYMNTHEYKKALRDIEKAELGFKKAKRNFEYLVANMNKGSILHELKQYQQAYDTYAGSMEAVLKLGDKYLTSSVYLNLGNTLREMGRYNEAVVYLRKALVINLELKAPDNCKDIYLSFSRTYEKWHRNDSALFYLNKYVDLKDSLFKEENLRQMNEMEARFQSDKKNAELKAKNEEIKANKALIDLKDEQGKRGVFIRNVLFGILALVVVFLVFMYRNNLQKKKAFREVNAQKQIIEQKNKEILDSIEYAKRIQRTLLASDSLLKKHLNDHFIFYKPKDIVSGDFYWATEAMGVNGQTHFMMCTADCTGHGVPGAFMSLLCISFLNEITRDSRNIQPNEVFTRLKREIVLSLNPEEAIHTRDGMDAVLCSFDFKNLKLQMACANNPVLIVRGDEMIEIKPDKNPIGKNEQTGYDYTLHQFDLQKGDLVYTFTDGYADQFGGSSGKKFKFRQFKETIFKYRSLSMKEQKSILESSIEKWKGTLEQLDDILVIGIRV